MEQNKKERFAAFRSRATGFLRQNGFTLVLVLCVAIIGVAAVATLLPGHPGETAPFTTPQTATPPPAEAASRSGDERLPAATPKATPSAAPAMAEEETKPVTAPSTAKPKEKKAQPPLSGEVVWGYAAEELIYSVTLEQWTTHPGVDIAAKPNTEVRAVLSGEVSDVYEDSALGVTVTIKHSGGKTSLYANLAPNPPVKKGQKLEAAAVVGLVGESAVSECMLESHLHFGFFVDGQPVNPKAHILLGK